MRRLALSLSICAFALSAQNKKIVVSGSDPETIKELRAASPKANIVPVTAATVMQEIVDADAYIGAIKPAEVRAGKNLKWVGIMSAGVETVLHKSGGSDLRDSNIILTNNQIVQGPEIADHALAMLLMLSRGLNKSFLQKQKEIWQARPYGGIELAGKNAVVIGVGGIGQQISIRAWALDRKSVV